VLGDFYGEGAEHFKPIPFVYEDHKRVHAFDKDTIDCALIALTYLEEKLLEANGRVPFSFQGQLERPWDEYDGFAILGFPTEDVTSDVNDDRSGPVTITVRPGLSPVKRMMTRPAGFPQHVAPWFYGELLDHSHPASIVGMSGGPIVGLKKNGENLDYWIIAIQSQWYEKPRITLGCPLPLVLDVLQNAVK